MKFIAKARFKSIQEESVVQPIGLFSELKRKTLKILTKPLSTLFLSRKSVPKNSARQESEFSTQ